MSTNISVEKFNDCLIEKHCPISKFCSPNYDTESFVQLVDCDEGDGLVAVTEQKVLNKILLKHSTPRCYIYPANKRKNINNYWHVNIYEQNKYRAQLS